MRRKGHGDESLTARAAWSRSGRRLVVVAVVVLVLLVAGVVASFVPLDWYAITPGSALPTAPLISVPPRLVVHHRGSVLLADVDLYRLDALDFLYFRLDGSASLYPASEVTGGTSANEYGEEGVIDMATAREAATVAALRALGYRLSAAPEGVVVYETENGSPAAGKLLVGEVITALDGHPVRALGGLVALLRALEPGALVTFSEHGLGSGRNKTVRLRLGAAEGAAAAPASRCVPVGAKPRGATARRAACIGAALEQLYGASAAPFRVSIDPGDIVGPSAGLAFALGLIEKLDPDDLTDGRRIAATGALSVSGAVGDVGGVAQKTIAVRAAGASVFLVPPEELAVARAHAGPHLKVLAVSSLAAAIADLERLGGRIGRPSAVATS